MSTTSIGAGLLLTAALGGLWTAVAMLYERAVGQRVRPLAFYVSSGLVAAPLAWLLVVDWHVLAQGWPADSAPLVLLMSGVGIVNMGLQVLVLFTLSVGHPSTVWTMTQSAMVIPFLAGALIWREPLSASITISLLLVLVGVAVLGSQRSGASSGHHPAWRWFALACFLGIGMIHVANTVPSHAGFAADHARLRVPLTMTAYAATALIACGFRRVWPGRSEFLFGSAYGVLAVAGALVMFRALDTLVLHQRAGLVFPMAVGLSIIGFAILSQKSRTQSRSRRWRLGMALVLLGMTGLAAMQVG